MSAELLDQGLDIFCGAKPVGHVVREKAIGPTDGLMGGRETQDIQRGQKLFLLRGYENIKS